MAKETVEAVRQAEIQAAQIEKDSFDKRDKIIIKAQEQKDEMILSIKKEVANKAKQGLEKAKKDGASEMVIAIEKAENEIVMLKEIVKKKEQAAIDYVLSEVI
jgi:V/A-type H+/Na+-transporting ATPase subunit G/H